MEIGETLYVATRKEFREWLEKNHKDRLEIWLIQYRKATKKPSLSLAEAVEEAMCFGFKGLDAGRYVARFTSRRPRSNWTEKNRTRAWRLIAEGKMTEAGLATLPKDI